jgi:CPA2 family monovalent cation:H+ antiporter-2
VCFAFALLADAVGYSVALGAFLAGALVAESGETRLVEQLVQPVRDIFAAIFFVAVGMLINPSLVAQHWVAVVTITILVVVGKLIGVAVGVFLTGEGVRTGIKAGMSLAQIGEFSFIIAGVGLSSGATRPFLYPIAVTVSAITTLLTPWLIRASDPVATYVDRRLPRSIQTFGALYGTWLEALRTQPREPTVGRRLRRVAGLILLDAALLAALVIVAAVWGGHVAAWLDANALVPPALSWIAVILAAMVLATPLAIGIVRSIASLAATLGAAALPLPATGVDFGVAPRRALVVALEIATVLAVGGPLVALTQPFLPRYSGPIVLAALALLLGIALWRSMMNLQEHARAGAQAIAEVLGRQRASKPTTAASADLEELHRLMPGLGAPQAIRITDGSFGVNRTLAQLNLRGLTGATVLAIVRDQDGVLIPTGRETLRAGDLLAVAGTVGAIESAAQLLGQARIGEPLPPHPAHPPS